MRRNRFVFFFYFITMLSLNDNDLIFFVWIFNHSTRSQSFPLQYFKMKNAIFSSSVSKLLSRDQQKFRPHLILKVGWSLACSIVINEWPSHGLANSNVSFDWKFVSESIEFRFFYWNKVKNDQRDAIVTEFWLDKTERCFQCGSCCMIDVAWVMLHDSYSIAHFI